MSMQVEEVLAPIPDDQRVSTASYQFWILKDTLPPENTTSSRWR